MWKRIKEFVEFLVNLQMLAPLVTGLLAILLAVAAFLAGLYTIRVPISLPLPIVVGVVALALYPVLKGIGWWFRPLEPFTYGGLLWRPSRLGFEDLKPLCPHKNCQREVVCRTIPPPRYQLLGGTSGMDLIQENSYIWLCSIHGQLAGVPNNSFGTLQEMAKLSQSQPKKK